MLTTIVAFSDSHNAPIPKRLLDLIDENNYVFFLGDGINSLGDVLLHKGFIGVNGNCDRPLLNDEEVLEIDNVKILITHGHKYGVKRDLTALALRAQELGCNVVFYGHTHFAHIDEYQNITFVCPGAISSPLCGAQSYAYAIIHNGKFTAKIVNLT